MRPVNIEHNILAPAVQCACGAASSYRDENNRFFCPAHTPDLPDPPPVLPETLDPAATIRVLEAWLLGGGRLSNRSAGTTDSDGMPVLTLEAHSTDDCNAVQGGEGEGLQALALHLLEFSVEGMASERPYCNSCKTVVQANKVRAIL